MPFLSPDWRYPGDKWLRSSECGSLWETAKVYRMRMFERMNESVIKRVCRRSLAEEQDPGWDYVNEFFKVLIYQPHVFLRPGSVREVQTTTTISEAFIGLDMKAAIRDVRRFTYVCKLIYILIADHFHKLTGRLQLFLIELLRTILIQVQISCNQTALFRNLLTALSVCLEVHKYDHIGSALLWQNHHKAVNEMLSELESFNIEERIRKVRKGGNRQALTSLSISEWSPTTTADVSLEQLPPECLSRVLSFINNPGDLETASQASNALASLVEETHLWRHLAMSHFTMDQISAVHFGRPGWYTDPPATLKDCNWRRAYMRLLKRYGDQHFYAAKLAVCEVCSCLFWPLFGHPCHNPDSEPRNRLLSPEEFVALFPL